MGNSDSKVNEEEHVSRVSLDPDRIFLPEVHYRSNVLVLGFAGSGKTSLYQLMQTGVPGGKRSIVSQTSKFVSSEMEVKLNGSITKMVSFIDSPGIGDTKVNSKDFVESMKKSLARIEKISKVLVLIPQIRMTNDQKDQVKEIACYLKDLGCRKENVCVVVTNVDFCTELVRLNIKREINDLLGTVNYVGIEIIFACLATPSDYVESVRSDLRDQILESKNNLEEVLSRPIVPFKPLEKHLEEIETELENIRKRARTYPYERCPPPAPVRDRVRPPGVSPITL